MPKTDFTTLDCGHAEELDECTVCEDCLDCARIVYEGLCGRCAAASFAESDERMMARQAVRGDAAFEGQLG